MTGATTRQGCIVLHVIVAASMVELQIRPVDSDTLAIVVRDLLLIDPDVRGAYLP